jgi:hypothetical protein
MKRFALAVVESTLAESSLAAADHGELCKAVSQERGPNRVDLLLDELPAALEEREFVACLL